MTLLVLLLGALSTSTPAPSIQTWDPDEKIAIPLQSESTSGGYWGLNDRKADHATVAMNSDGDMLVAYHSSRPDFNTAYETLKQVEIALVVYDSMTDSWSLETQNQLVVGGVDPSPLSGTYQQADVKCERPDVIAVGKWFFVVWTRIYERQYGRGNPSDQINEPAVLECAWVKKDSSGNLQVFTDGAAAGAGFELDRDSVASHFFVRECAGCPDAVVLHPGDDNTPPTVGVVYPHQTNFGDYGSPADNTRLFQLRFQTCSIDLAANPVITSVAYPALVGSDDSTTGIVYDGDNSAAGIVLPDVAPGSVNWRFGLAYEEQLKPSSVTNGRIILQSWDVDEANTSLAMLESHAFGNTTTTAYRRRPMLSSYPSAFPGQDVFALAFNKLSATFEGDVIYQEWDLTEGANLLAWEYGWGWTQGCDDRKPVPLLGREISNGKYFGRCYAECANNSELYNYVRLDANDEDTIFSIVNANQLQRPAASYWFETANGSDHVALTWEQETTVGSLAPVRIWLLME